MKSRLKRNDVSKERRKALPTEAKQTEQNNKKQSTRETLKGNMKDLGMQF